MYWVSLPVWFWFAYYLFLLIIFSSAILNIIRKAMITSSIIALLFTITVPMFSLINGIARPVDQNKYELLLIHLRQGSLLAFYTIIGYAYLSVWFVILLLTLKEGGLIKKIES